MTWRRCACLVPSARHRPRALRSYSAVSSTLREVRSTLDTCADVAGQLLSDVRTVHRVVHTFDQLFVECALNDRLDPARIESD